MKMGPDFDCSWNDHSVEDSWEIMYGDKCVKKEVHMFVNACWSDELVGGICLGISFLLMFLSLGGVGFGIWHERLVLGVLGPNSDLYCIATPTYDVYMEQISFANPDLVGIRIGANGHDVKCLWLL